MPSTHSEVIIRGGVVVTVDPDFAIETGDVACRDGEIVQVGGRYVPSTSRYEIIEADGCIVMPGLVQSHVHMCQTLARGRADDLELLDWLRRVIWPYESVLDRDDVATAAQLACAELLAGGTTSILDMGTVHHTDALFEVARDSGLRATIGKAMMDEHGEGVPAALCENTGESVAESTRLCAEWNGKCGGRLRYAFAPRFALSCTDDLLSQAGTAAKDLGVRIHTHASENRAELEEVRKRKGVDNVEHLHNLGLTGPHACLAHCVWLSSHEREILRETGTHLLHCPSSNLKLGSGIASIPEMINEGVSVSLGADGAPCNNNLDAFWEMRLAALIHNPRCGAKAMHAAAVVRIATMGGAYALGIDDQVGSLEAGKRGDIIVIDTQSVHATPSDNPYSSIIYACRSSDVRDVIVDGRMIVRDRQLLTLDRRQVIADAQAHSQAIFSRIGL